ncbi:MAG TPA: hypothetical protein PLV92_12915, partial [Pirellulaceae bacterium]|nr:hypothetical protein [Pirellulaceae bacterium]
LRERHLCAAPLEATLRKLARRELAFHASTNGLQGAGREQSKESPWETLRRALQVATDAAGLGIEVVRFGIVAVRPPLAVLPADHEVAAARSDAVRSMIEARNGARAELDRIAMVAASETAEARGAAAVRHAQVRGDAARFSGLAAAFAIAPATERQRLYCDVVGGVLAQRPVVLVDSTLAEVVQLRFDGGPRRDDAE